MKYGFLLRMLKLEKKHFNFRNYINRVLIIFSSGEEFEFFEVSSIFLVVGLHEKFIEFFSSILTDQKVMLKNCFSFEK